METTIFKSCTKPCIEYDSELVNHARSNTSIIRWDLDSRWLKCFVRSNTTCVHFSHTFREDSQCADKRVEFDTRSQG